MNVPNDETSGRISNEKLKEFAECQYSYLNLLLVGCLKRYGVMCRTIDQVISELRKAINAYGGEN